MHIGGVWSCLEISIVRRCRRMVGKWVVVPPMSQSAWRSANRAAGDGGMDQNILPHRGVHELFQKACVFTGAWRNMDRLDS
jgi:hypothetical protein